MKDKNKFRGFVRQLIEKLRVNGYAFDSIKTVLDRKFKIAKMLDNDAMLGFALSPVLKHNSQIRLEFCVNSIKIYVNEETQIGDLVLLQIDDAYERSLNDLVFKIGKFYSKYFYTKEELQSFIEECGFSVKREPKIHKMLSKLSKDLPLRICVNSFLGKKFVFGSSYFSIEVFYSKNTKALHTSLLVYKTNSRKYNYCLNYELGCIRNKYMMYMNNVISIQYLNLENVGLYIHAYNMIKKLENNI